MIIRIGYAALGAGSTPVWMAQEAGLFAAEGLETEVVLIRGSKAAAAALMDGSAQFGNFAAPAVVEANLQGGDLVYLTGGLNYLVQSLITRAEIDEPSKLRGRTLGVGEAGDIQDTLLRYLLERHGLGLGDVNTLHASNQPEAIAMMDAGTIDGAIFSPPYSFVAAKRGHRVLVDAGDYRLDYQLGGIVARRSYVDAHPDVVEKVVRGYVRGVHRFKTQPAEAIQVYRKYSLIEDEEVARQCWASNDRSFMPVPYPTMKGLQAVIQQVAGEDERTVTAEGMADLRWVRRLEEDGFIRALYDFGTKGLG